MASVGCCPASILLNACSSFRSSLFSCSTTSAMFVALSTALDRASWVSRFSSHCTSASGIRPSSVTNHSPAALHSLVLSSTPMPLQSTRSRYCWNSSCTFFRRPLIAMGTSTLKVCLPSHPAIPSSASRALLLAWCLMKSGTLPSQALSRCVVLSCLSLCSSAFTPLCPLSVSSLAPSQKLFSQRKIVAH